MKYISCKYCGSEYASSIVYCTKCGKPLERKSKINPYIIFGIVVLILLLIIPISGNKEKHNYSNNRVIENTISPPVIKTTKDKAVDRAKSYLKSNSFSYQDLVSQLEYEGFSHEDAIYGVDHCEANWNEQALLKAKSYLKTGGFSYIKLYDQLEYHGFEKTQIDYALKNCNADWNEQAVQAAKSYMRTFPEWSKSKLIDQLEYEHFTYEQAKYGADHY